MIGEDLSILVKNNWSTFFIIALVFYNLHNITFMNFYIIVYHAFVTFQKFCD